MIVYPLGNQPLPERLRAGGVLVDQIRKVAFLGRPGELPPDQLPGEAQEGLDGLRYWIVEDGLTLADLRKRDQPDLVVTVDLGDFGQVPIMPAMADGFVIGLDGTVDTTRPGSAYARLAYALEDRLAEEQEITVTDPQVLALARAAVATTHRGTAELWHHLGLFTRARVLALCRGVWQIPKA